MNAKPWAERVYIVVGVVVGLIVAVGAMTSPGAAVGMALCGVALVALVAMARFLDRISGFK